MPPCPRGGRGREREVGWTEHETNEIDQADKSKGAAGSAGSRHERRRTTGKQAEQTEHGIRRRCNPRGFAPTDDVISVKRNRFCDAMQGLNLARLLPKLWSALRNARLVGEINARFCSN